MSEESKTPSAAKQQSDSEVVQRRIVDRLRRHVRDMDARISMAQVEIREKQSAVGQLEKEKWALDREVDEIERILSVNSPAHAPEP